MLCSHLCPVDTMPRAELSLEISKWHYWKERPRFHPCLCPDSFLCQSQLLWLSTTCYCCFTPSFLATCCFLYMEWHFSSDIYPSPAHTLKFILETALTHYLFGNPLFNPARDISSLAWICLLLCVSPRIKTVSSDIGFSWYTMRTGTMHSTQILPRSIIAQGLMA